MAGKRPKVMCPACRKQSRRSPTLCFQCYRAELERERALKAAGQLDTASEARFQSALPFDPVNKPRLDMLRAERMASRSAFQKSAEFVEKRRRAQIAARHALLGIAAGLRSRGAATIEQERVVSAAIHAAELQLPESWLAFVIAR